MDGDGHPFLLGDALWQIQLLNVLLVASLCGYLFWWYRYKR
jgi:hypothetical protein